MDGLIVHRPGLASLNTNSSSVVGVSNDRLILLLYLYYFIRNIIYNLTNSTILLDSNVYINYSLYNNGQVQMAYMYFLSGSYMGEVNFRLWWWSCLIDESYVCRYCAQWYTVIALEMMRLLRLCKKIYFSNNQLGLISIYFFICTKINSG